MTDSVRYIVRKPIFLLTTRTFSVKGNVIPLLEVSPENDKEKIMSIFMGETITMPKNNYVENHIRLVGEEMVSPGNPMLYDEKWCLEHLICVPKSTYSGESEITYTQENLYKLFCSGFYKALHAAQYEEMGYKIYVSYGFQGLKGMQPIHLTKDTPADTVTDEYRFFHDNAVLDIDFNCLPYYELKKVGILVPNFYVILMGSRPLNHPGAMYLGDCIPEHFNGKNLTTTVVMAKKFKTEDGAIDFALTHEDYMGSMSFQILKINRRTFII